MQTKVSVLPQSKLVHPILLQDCLRAGDQISDDFLGGVGQLLVVCVVNPGQILVVVRSCRGAGGQTEEECEVQGGHSETEVLGVQEVLARGGVRGGQAGGWRGWRSGERGELP